MKNNLYKMLGFSGIILASVLVVSLINPAQVFAAPSLTTTVDVENVAVGNQTASTSATQPNVPEVKASSTIAFSSIPTATSTIVIGACTVTFSTTTVADPACADLAAVVKFDAASSTSELVTAVAAITGATSTHGAITFTAGAGAASSTLNFRTTGAETLATTIEFVPLVGKIATTSETAGTLAVAQRETITIGGTAAAGNTFSFFSGAFSTSTISVGGDTNQTIANRLNTLITTTTGYGDLLYTSATGTNTVVLTAKTPGTGFTSATTSVSEFAGVAQVVTFTPADIRNSRYTYSISINSVASTFDFNGGIDKTIVEGLSNALAGSGIVSCTENNTALTCTAITPGTAFTYSTSVTLVSSEGSGSSSHRSSGASLSSVLPITSPVVPTDIATLRAQLTKQLVGLMQELLKQLVAELSALQGN